MMIIAAMTWKELMRKRVMTLTVIMTAIFLVAFWFVAKSIGSDTGMASTDPTDIGFLMNRFRNGAITLTLGFFFGSFVIAFLSIFASFSAIAGEAEQGVMQAMLPRPIKRWQWYMGRWSGYVGIGVVYALLLFLSLLFITSIHSSVPRDLTVLLISFLLFASGVPVLVSLAMLGSCRFSAFGNGVFVIMLYGAGWLGGMMDKVMGYGLFQEEAMDTLKRVSGILSLIMPVDSLQRRMLAELFSFSDLGEMVQLLASMGPFGFEGVPSNSYLIYSACYTTVLIVGGLLAFQRKDF